MSRLWSIGFSIRDDCVCKLQSLYQERPHGGGLEIIAAINFKTICIPCSRQEVKTHWGIERRSQIFGWYSIEWEMASRSTRTARYTGKRIYKECLITVEGTLTRQFRTPITSAGCPTTRDRWNFHRQSHRAVPRLDLEGQFEGVNTQGYIHSVGGKRWLKVFFLVSFFGCTLSIIREQTNRVKSLRQRFFF